jgi:hypothetical protein
MTLTPQKAYLDVTKKNCRVKQCISEDGEENEPAGNQKGKSQCIFHISR